jgi:hypothetical protein
MVQPKVQCLLDPPLILVMEFQTVINTFNPRHPALDLHPTAGMEFQTVAGSNQTP